LQGLRVVEVSIGAGAAYAGRVLATLGAEVIVCEPDGGSPLRRAPPILSSTQTSAQFAYLSAGKRFLSLDRSSAEGQIAFHELLADVDLLIEDCPLHRKQHEGFDQAQIAVRHRGLVHVSILPFGATGPKSHWKAEEVNLIHASGEGNLLPNGIAIEMFPNRPPLRIHGDFIGMNAGMAAVLGGLSALWARPAVGGQFVDISMQECGAALALYTIQQLGDGFAERRQGRAYRYGGVVPCRDGYVELITIEDKQWWSLVRLMGDPEWAFDEALRLPAERSKRGDEINGRIRVWAGMQSAQDLVDRGQALGVPIAKYSTPAEILNGAQERARQLFASCEIEGVGHREMLVAPFHFDSGPLRLEPARSVSLTDVVPARRPNATAASSAALRAVSDLPDKPLAGVRVLDLTQHAAGPFGTHLLTQLGALCIKVESGEHPDIFRRAHPLYGRFEAALFAHVMTDKRSVRINLKRPQGIALLKRLIPHVDIVTENYRAGVMQRLGLDFETLRQLKPDLIMVSACASGQAGPDAHFGGYAPLFGAWGGLGTLSGYADGPPLELRHAMDHAVGLTAASAALAALHGRRLTGAGTHVDLSAREVACALIGEALLQAAHGDEPQRVGNGHLGMAPYGVYPALGDDRWVSLAVAHDGEWKTLAQLIGASVAPERFPYFSMLAGRLAHRDELDTLVGAWTRQRDAEETAVLLQQHGIAAHASLTPEMLVADEQLRERQAIRDFVVGGKTRPAVRVPVMMSKTRGSGIVDAAPPPFGGGEDFAFGELLGMSNEERRALEAEGVIA